MDDETGLQPRLVGFDMKEPTAHNMGKPEAIATLRHTFPYETIVMVGDGITGASVCALCTVRTVTPYILRRNCTIQVLLTCPCYCRVLRDSFELMHDV